MKPALGSVLSMIGWVVAFYVGTTLAHHGHHFFR